MARKQTDTRYIYRHMTTREASGVEGGQGGGPGEGTTRNTGGATPDEAAATHAAAGGGEATQGQRFSVAANNDELRAIVVPYPTAAAHNGDWKKVHDVTYVEKLIAQQEEGTSYGMRLRQHSTADC